ADIDDLAAAARDHMTRYGLADIEDRGQVGGNDLVEFFRRKGFEAGAELHSGIVDQDIDGADLVLDMRHRVVDTVAAGDVEGHRIDRGAGGRKVLRGGAERDSVAGIEYD